MKIRTSTDGFKEGTVTIFSFVLTAEPTSFQWILPNCSVATQMALVKFGGSQKDLDMDWERDMSGQVGTGKSKRRRKIWGDHN